MNVSKLNIGPTAQFGRQKLLQEHRAQKQKCAPLEDALQRLAANAFDAKAKGLEKDAEAKKLAVEMDAYVSSLGEGENRALKDMDDEELLLWQHIFTQTARYAQDYEDRLLDFRDQLSAFDQTIRDYQDMLDGKKEMTEGLTHEKVTELLDQMKSAREQFLMDNKESVENGRSRFGGLTLSRLARAVGPDGEAATGEYANKDESFWRINFQTDDIYGEIDRVLGGVRGLGQRLGETLDAITNELKKRGYTEDNYQRYFDNLREELMPVWRRQDDPAAIVKLYMEKAAEEADEDL